MLVTGVRFKPAGKIYYFTSDGIDLKEGDGVIVETQKGVEFARAAFVGREVPYSEIPQPPVKPIMRKATEADVEQTVKNEQKSRAAVADTRVKAEKHRLGMKVIDCEYTFDCAKLVIYFTAEGRVDFRELVKDLASHFKTRIELRQIGVRDESKMKGGVAPCGRICCCGAHLPDFARVSIKMAKTQGLSLNPAKISGLCGRLMCCLEYENQHYAESAKLMPKIGSEVTVPEGQATVMSNNLLKHTVRVKKTNADGTFVFYDHPLKDVKGKETMADEPDTTAADPDIKSILD